MSEYQYYEFRAVDRPLMPEQMSELRALSSRAAITPLRFTNTYNYSDFRGDPRILMESYYDAHVYVSNFGTLTLMLRLPRIALPDDTLAEYATDEGLAWWATDEHTILEWRREEDPFDEWMDGEKWMDRLLPLRDELVRGDYRSLYIGWLASLAGASLEDDEEEEDADDEEEEDADDEEIEDDAEDDVEDEDYGGSARRREPPVPAGLGSLTAAQSALTEFLGVDSDLLAAAAEASPKAPALAESADQTADWVAQLSDKEVRSIVGRILNGEGLRVQTELQSRYSRSRSEAPENTRTGNGRNRRTAAELLTIAAKAEEERKRQESEKRKRARNAQLSGLVPRFAALWSTVNASAEEQKASSYDQACTLLIDMRDAYDHAGRRPEFDAEFARFLGKYSRRTALIRKLKEVGLTS